jgi:hypothetical protein
VVLDRRGGSVEPVVASGGVAGAEPRGCTGPLNCEATEGPQFLLRCRLGGRMWTVGRCVELHRREHTTGEAMVLGRRGRLYRAARRKWGSHRSRAAWTYRAVAELKIATREKDDGVKELRWCGRRRNWG